MKLKQLASNMTELTLNNSTIVLFSYETPVAAYLSENIKMPLGHYVREIKTNKKWSRTTSKHIAKWNPNHTVGTAKDFEEVDQEVLDNLVK